MPYFETAFILYMAVLLTLSAEGTMNTRPDV